MGPPKMSSVRTFQTVAAAREWELYQMDVNSALLYGDSEEEVHIRLPPSFTSSWLTKVRKLRKSPYGLH